MNSDTSLHWIFHGVNFNLATMVRMQIRGGIRWPKNIDFRYVPTPGRQSWGDLRKIIRLAKYGCANRPFYHIEVTKVSLFLKIVLPT